MGLPTARDVTFSAGAEVPATVLNDMQDGIVGHEQLLRALGPGMLHDGFFWPAEGGTQARPLGRCGAFYVQTAGAGPTVFLRGGLWLQNTGDSTFPYFVYRATDGEVFQALNNFPGAGQYRRDILCVKLQASGGVISIAKSYVAGTPAGSDAGALEPATTSGYTKVACFLLSGAAGVGSVDVKKIRDHRVPLGMRIIDVLAPDWHLFEADWNRVAFSITSDGSGARLAFAMARDAGANQRLMKVGIASLLPVSSIGAASLVRVGFNAGITDLTFGLGTELYDNAFHYNEKSLYDLDVPMWMNGYQSGLAAQIGSGMESIGATACSDQTEFEKLAVQFLSDASLSDTIFAARFFIAGAFDGDF